MTFEIVPMTMYYQIRKGVDSNIFGCVDVMHITVNEENKTTEQLLHYFVKGTFITIEETAVATCCRYPCKFLLIPGSRLTPSLIIRLSGAQFLITKRKSP